MKKYLLFFFSSLVMLTTYSQSTTFTYKDYALEKEVDINTDKLETADYNYIVLKHTNVKEYLFENETYIEYNLIHRRIKILSEKGIELNNKVFISLYETDLLDKYAARVINKNGVVTNLDETALKEGIDPESNMKHVYFAFEQISVGSVIEYFYIKKRAVRGTSSAISIQENVPKYDVNYEIISPPYLIYETKSLNGLPDFKVDTTVTDKQRKYLSAAYIEAYKQQENAFDGANRQYFYFKLDKNTATGVHAIESYADISEKFYESIHDLEKKDKKAVTKIIKKIDVSAADEEGKIRAVENYIKTNYSIIDNSSQELRIITSIYENKAMNKSGALKLFVALFAELGIKHEVVFTSDRTEFPFDKDFEAYFFLDKSLIYFPKIKKILDPGAPLYRLGWTDTQYMNCYGLFIKGVKVSDYYVGIGEIKFIAPLPKEMNYDKITIDVDFSQGFEGAVYRVKNEALGFKAYTQSLYDFIKDEEKLTELKKIAIEYIDSEGEIKDLKVTNEGGNNFGIKPLITEANLVSDKFIEYAGQTLLFKLGELIGPQMELYQEEKRELPVQLSFNRSYQRKITFTIPEDYQIKNLDDINITEEHKDKESGEVVMAFYSSYKQEGNKVTVESSEFYNKLELPKEEFESYQRVINAAANFNKIVLILEKGK